MGVAATGLAAACSGDEVTGDDLGDAAATTTTRALPVPQLGADPFGLGVASGDPLPDSVVLWTRLVDSDGLVSDDDVPVRWIVSSDEVMENSIADGTAVAPAEHGHAVHVDVTGLDPATTYWYRFEVGEHVSAIGRTATAPASGASPDQIRLGIVNCQAYQSGYYTAYRHLADEELDVVVFLGDYIYELESSIDVRPHGMAPPSTLDEFRAFYELNKRDPDLQAAHAAFPWIVTWDDHEVEDNYAGLIPGEIGAERASEVDGGFPAIRAAAYEAWWEHMPVRADPPDSDGEIPIYRDFMFGDLLTMPVLDTRQYRTEQPKGEGAGALPRAFGGGPQLPGAFDPDATVLGADQEAWLFDVLDGSEATWNVLAQQSVMAEVNRAPSEPEGRFSMDSWDGYVVPRQRLLDFIDEQQVENLVSVGGDIHTSAVTDLHLDPTDPTSSIVGAEFIAPSISSLELLLPEFVEGALANGHIHLYDTDQRGYLTLTFTSDAATAEFKYTSIGEPDAPLVAGTSWRVEAGTPGARPL